MLPFHRFPARARASARGICLAPSARRRGRERIHPYRVPAAHQARPGEATAEMTARQRVWSTGVLVALAIGALARLVLAGGADTCDAPAQIACLDDEAQ